MLNNIRKNKSFISIVNLIGRIFKFLPPNLITTISLVVVFVSGYYYYLGEPYIGAVILAISGFLDLVDGSVAKYTKRTTVLGGFLDSTFDRIGDGVVLLGIGLSYDLTICFIIMIGAYLISYMCAK
ncbi:MAG: CDP-alcohol phosphatidyltransferase family protein, partial [Candidatus Methanofastidiosa archaeon]|nr:CDP-alcohol phosphatidyltransferase family protein [Candidatus Methanofastidiosa archaeon]